MWAVSRLFDGSLRFCYWVQLTWRFKKYQSLPKKAGTTSRYPYKQSSLQLMEGSRSKRSVFIK